MKRLTKPNFRLQRVYSDGCSEEPMYYRLVDVDNNWKMGRRGFLGISLAAVGSLSGCAQPDVRQEPTPARDKNREAAGEFEKSGRPEERKPASIEKKALKTSKENAVAITGSCPEGVTAHKHNVDILNFSPSGKILASVGEEGTIKLWRMPSGELIRTLEVKSAKSISFRSGEDVIASGSFSDRGIELWELSSGNLLRRLRAHRFDHVKAVSFSPDGRLLASGLYNHTIHLWGIPSCNLLKKLSGHKDSVDVLSFSPNGKLLASGSKGDVKLWKFPQGVLYKALRVPSRSDVTTISFSPDGKLLAAGLSGSVKIWKIPNSKLFWTLRLPKMLDVTAVSFSPDGKFLAVASGDKTMLIWNIKAKKVVKTFRGKLRYDNFIAVSFSPDGKLLASGSENRTIQIWEMPSGKLLTCLFDPATLLKGRKMNRYRTINKYGYVITRTMPCGSPIPQGAVCTCNCVPGTWVNANSAPRIRRKGGSYNPGTRRKGRSYSQCSCNKICTCVPVAY